MNNNYNIYWNNIDNSTFMYGSQLQMKHHHVSFTNFQIPAGIVLHTWRMKTSFYQQRMEPSLPLLARNETYTIHFNYQCEPVDGIYFIIEYYMKNDELIESVIVKESAHTFVYPANADYYQIKMMSASVNRLVFEKIVISHPTLIMDMSNAVEAFERWSGEVL